jgi:D-alanyl-D-alanine carboxypeptidase
MRLHRLYEIALVLLLALAGCSRGPIEPSADEREQVHALLAALNAGDRPTLEAYAHEHTSPEYHDTRAIERGLLLHKQYGGFDLLELKEISPRQVHGWVHAKDSDAVLELALDFDERPPHRITFLHIDWGDVPDAYRVAPLPEAAAVDAWRADTKRRAAADKFSGAILLTRSGEVLVREAFGFADRDAGIENTVDTRFRTASTSKMFTAAAVMRLVQDGRVRLDDAIGRVVPALAGKPVANATIAQLLSHQSGAGEFLGPRYEEHERELKVHDDYVRVFGGDALLFPPGEKFAYSNLGYLYLGAAIEHASGKSFYKYLDEAVFKPAGMTNTDTPPPDVDMKGRAFGYIKPPGTRQWVSAAQYLDYRADGAGGAWSSIDDMQRFLVALRGNRILDAKHTKLMLGQKAEAWKGHGYGYGVWIDSYPKSARGVGGIGGEMGSNSEAWILPDSGYEVVVLSNFDPGAAVSVSEFIRARLPRDP